MSRPDGTHLRSEVPEQSEPVKNPDPTEHLLWWSGKPVVSGNVHIARTERAAEVEVLRQYVAADY